MSETKTFNVADPEQLAEVLKILQERDREVRDYIFDLTAVLGQMAYGISLLPENEPITKARLLTLAQVIEAETPKSDSAQMIRRMLAGELDASPPPTSPQPRASLRLVVSNPPRK